jgi:hypothetical protein
MKRSILYGAVALMAGSLLAADSDSVKAAAKKLAAESNYSWKTVIVVPEGGGGNRFRPGPTEGKTEKDGYTFLSMTRGDNKIEAVIKGDKGAAKMEDDWQSLSELAGDGQPGPGTFMARRLRSYKTPAAEAEDLAGKTQGLKKDGDVYSGDLTEEGAKSILSFGGGRAGGGGQAPPEPKNAKGSVKFWLKDGQLAKYEHKVSGTISFGGEDRDMERTTTVEIKDVGKTKVEVPEEAKKKLEK